MQSTKIRELAGLQLRRPVFDLGSVTPELEGIYSPGYADSEIGEHVHETFLKDADAYLNFCTVDRPSIEHWKLLIMNALGGFRPETVLDIGSGGGISVLPTLELFGEARVIATDLAVPMLSQLRNLARRDNLAMLTVLQMNAEDILFSEGQVDLVMGGNVLHHALSLDKIFVEIRRVLRPGGRAVFWEAFEHGSQILASIFDLWLSLSPYQPEPLPSRLASSLDAYVCDLQRRVGRTKPLDILKTMDDKWIFTFGQLRDLAARAGFSSCDLRNIYGSDNVVRTLADHELRRKGHSWDEVPSWARQKLLQTEARYSPDCLNENPFCCSILLT